MTQIFQYLTRVLTMAGNLDYNSNIGLFPFKNYRSDSIENVSLMLLWNFMYVSKFTWGIPIIKASIYAYRGQMAIVAKMGLVQMLCAYEILEILNDELDSNA